MARKLTAKEEAFCQQYIVLGTYTAAYRAAYDCARMKPEVVAVKGSQVAARPQVRARLAELQAAQATAHGITQERVLTELGALAFSRVDEVVTWQGNALVLRDADEIPLRARAAIKSMKARVIGTTEPKGAGMPILEIEVKMHEKTGPANSLARHLGLFKGETEEAVDGLVRLLREIDGRDRGLPGH